ncbi:AbgT family transporter [Staphylococcus aureus]
MTSKHQQKGSYRQSFLNSVEDNCNNIASCLVLFFLMWLLSIIIVTLSHYLMYLLSIQVRIKPFILKIISDDGFTMIMNDTIKNFSEFPALGLVLAVMIGIGVAEKNKILRQVNDFCCESRTTIFNFTDYYINWYFR